MELRKMKLVLAVLCLAAWQLPLCGQQTAGGNDSGPQITIRLVAASDTGKTENAQALGDPRVFEAHIAAALKDL